MNTTTVTIEGNLISAEVLAAIAAGDAPGQAPADFGLDRSRRLSDEIAALWTEVRDYWRAFQHRLDRARRSDPTNPATTETRERWVGPLLEALGYELTFQPQAAVVGGRTYAISHRAGKSEAGEDAPPVHIVGFPRDSDHRPLEERAASGRPRLSPHGLMQEYLNSTEHLWGIITDGAHLRLLRDSARTVRPTYIEFDLQAMMAGEKYAEFALLYRLLHRSRLPLGMDDAPRCWLEQYHQQAIEEGGRVREKLRAGVQQALEALGAGLLAHPRNADLRARLVAGTLTAPDYYRQLLRLVYRLLFLMVAEERKLIGGSPDGQARYLAHYSVTRLRHLAETPGMRRGHYGDLWLGLAATFAALEDDDNAKALGVQALDGDLFGSGALPDLGGTHLDNAALLQAVTALSVYQDRATGTPRRVNYSALDVEELGSVYESLLDLRPLVSPVAGGVTFALVAGTERKTTGSYYTRPELVHELIKSALEPVLESRLAAAGPDAAARARAILAITVCDPACGSGHFLLAAARRLGRELARLRSGEDQPGPAVFRAAVRDVIAHSIYGVDANPLAVDLCKLALWIESMDVGRPLSFLDNHIRWGNSLIGATRALVEAGIPDDAYAAVTGDDRAVATQLRKQNREARARRAHSGEVQLSMQLNDALHDLRETLAAADRALNEQPGENVPQVRAKAAAYEQLRGQADQDRTIYNLWTAAFFLPLTAGAAVPTTQDVFDTLARPGHNPRLEDRADDLAATLGFFHWELEFPRVFDGGGFDVVLGNPPWERIKLQEEEHWVDDPYIGQARNKAERERHIQEYRAGTPAQRARVALFDFAKHATEAESKFVRNGGRFLLTGVGDVNTYALFAEHAHQVLNSFGRAGIIVPIGVVTDDTTKMFSADLINKQNLARLIGFENEAFIFPDVHNEFKFCALTMTGEQIRTEQTDFAFFCRYFEQVEQEERHFRLSRKDFALLNPNTRTCPVFRTQADAELTKKLYNRVPVLSNDELGENTWGASFLRMFDMANDSGLFRTRESLIAEGNSMSGNFFIGEKGTYLPLYEAKMIWQFDHRFASFIGRENAGTRPSRKYEGWYGVDPTNADELPMPGYWISQEEVVARLISRWDQAWLLTFRDVASNVVERTSIFSLLPRVGVGHTAPLILLNHINDARLVCCFLACVDSLTFDYVTRQKLAGIHLSYGILKQLPVLPPDAFSAADVAYLSERVLELVYTAWDLAPFAADVWAALDPAARTRVQARWAASHGTLPPPGDGPPPPFRWDDARRAAIRAELDARIARLYGLTRDELRYILDPALVYGPTFPGETFRVLKEKETRLYGEYRTARLVLAAWDAAGLRTED